MTSTMRENGQKMTKIKKPPSTVKLKTMTRQRQKCNDAKRKERYIIPEEAITTPSDTEDTLKRRHI